MSIKLLDCDGNPLVTAGENFDDDNGLEVSIVFSGYKLWLINFIFLLS